MEAIPCFNFSGVNGRAGFKGISRMVAVCAIATLVLASCGTAETEPQEPAPSVVQSDTSEPAVDQPAGNEGLDVESTIGAGAGNSTTTVPDAAVPQTTTSPESGSTTTVPDAAVPQTTTSPESGSTTTVPDAAVPQTTTSPESGPTTTVPDAAVPQTTTSPESGPTTTVPDAAVPQTTTSPESGPTTTVPDAAEASDTQATTPPDNTTTTMLPPPPSPPVTTRATSGGTAFTQPTTTLPIRVVPPPSLEDDVFYEDYGINLPTETALQPYSTFGLDTDTASWFRQFLYLDEGVRPPPEAIRAEEIINVFPARCESESPLSVRICAQASSHPFRGDGAYRLLRVSVDVTPVEQQPPTTYIVVLDRSGSMSMGDRWNMALGVIENILGGLRAEDRLGMVSFNYQALVNFEPTDADSARSLYSDTALYPDESTNAGEGLRLGYELAGRERESHPDQQVLVVFLSDGVANTGLTTEPGGIFDLLGASSDLDIGMAAGGVGEGNYNDYLLEQVADRAQGWYQYLYDEVSTSRFVSKVRAGIVGWEAKAQVEFNPDTVTSWRLIGYENRQIEAGLFREDEQVEQQSAPLVGGSSSAAWYEIELTDASEGWLAEATVRYQTCRDCDFQESDAEVSLPEVSAFSEAACDYRVQGYAAWYAEFARQSPFAWESSTPQTLMETIGSDPGPDAGDCLSNIDELRTVLSRYIESVSHSSVYP